MNSSSVRAVDLPGNDLRAETDAVAGEAGDALQEALAAELRGALAIANVKVPAWRGPLR